MSTHKNLAVAWDDPRGKALRDAHIVIGGGAARRVRQWQRHDVLAALYSLSGGKAGVPIDTADLESASGLPQGQVMNAVDSLEQEGALRSYNGGCVDLTPKGIGLHERRATRPYRAVFVESASGSKPGLVATVPDVDLCRRQVT